MRFHQESCGFIKNNEVGIMRFHEIYIRFHEVSQVGALGTWKASQMEMNRGCTNVHSILA